MGRSRLASVSAAPTVRSGATTPSGSLASAATPKAANPATTRARRVFARPVRTRAKPQARAAANSVSGRT